MHQMLCSRRQPYINRDYTMLTPRTSCKHDIQEFQLNNPTICLLLLQATQQDLTNILTRRKQISTENTLSLTSLPHEGFDISNTIFPCHESTHVMVSLVHSYIHRLILHF